MAIKAQKSGGFFVKCCHLFSHSSLQKFTAFACRYPSFLCSGYVILHGISLCCLKSNSKFPAGFTNVVGPCGHSCGQSQLSSILQVVASSVVAQLVSTPPRVPAAMVVRRLTAGRRRWNAEARDSATTIRKVTIPVQE